MEVLGTAEGHEGIWEIQPTDQKRGKELMKRMRCDNGRAQRVRFPLPATAGSALMSRGSVRTGVVTADFPLDSEVILHPTTLRRLENELDTQNGAVDILDAGFAVAFDVPDRRDTAEAMVKQYAEYIARLFRLPSGSIFMGVEPPFEASDEPPAAAAPTQ